MATRYLRLPSRCTTPTFERHAIRWLCALLDEVGLRFTQERDAENYLQEAGGRCHDYELMFDLRDVQYIGLHEMLMLNILGEFCQHLSGNKVRVYMPRSHRIRKFLSTFGFFRYFYGWGTSPSEGSVTDDSEFVSGRLLQITRIESVEDVGEATSALKTQRIAAILRRMIGSSEKVNRLADTIISEVCQNIPEHSRRQGKGHGYCAVQSHGRAESWTKGLDVESTVEVAVVDGGIGIRQSLVDRHPSLFARQSAADCIEHVLTRKLPRDGTRDRGGLLRVMKSVSEDFGGTLKYRSTNGMLIWRPDGTIHKQSKFPFCVGTQFRLLLPIQGT